MREFLEEDDSPWLWFVDADMVFDKGHPMKLWEAASEYEADVVSGLAFIYKDSKYPVPSYFYRGAEGDLLQHYNRLPESGEVIAASGFASVLIHRRVVEAMQAPRHEDYRWFDFLPNKDIGINADEMTGIDVQFFIRAAALGFRVVAEPLAKTAHQENIFITESEWERTWASQSS
jgi:hypothetical protein